MNVLGISGAVSSRQYVPRRDDGPGTAAYRQRHCPGPLTFRGDVSTDYLQRIHVDVVLRIGNGLKSWSRIGVSADSGLTERPAVVCARARRARVPGPSFRESR